MFRLLSAAGRLAAGRPVAVLLVLATLTGLFGALASRQQVATDITEFAPEGELQDVLDRIDATFGGSEQQLQVIVDAGRGGDVLGPEGLRAAEAVAEVVHDTDELAGVVATEGPGDGVLSYALPVLPRLAAVGADLEDVSDRILASIVEDAFASPQGQQLITLLSGDPRRATARAGLVLVELRGDADEDAVADAARALGSGLAARDLGFVRVDPFSFVLLTEEIEAGFEEDLPLLLGISFLLIVAVLAVMFRTVSDVALGVVGLLVSLVWMVGLSVLLGPDLLQVTGTFSQIAIAVPVLLVGLGVDYSVHLSARYREEWTSGSDASGAAVAAVTTVGAALTLATATTVIGFLSNVVSPLPPIADFGWFAAVGILSSFVVLGLGVPAGRVLVDRGRDRDGPRSGSAHGTGRAIRVVAGVPARAPLAAIVFGVLAAAAGGALATQLDTTFDQEQFLPDGSEASRLLGTLDGLFGGDVSERTQVLLTGDVRRPAVFTAMLEAEERLADVGAVVTSDGRAEIRSPAALLRQLDQQAAATRQQLAAQFALLHDPATALETLPLPDTLSVADLPADLLGQLSSDDLTRLGDGGGPLPLDDLDALEARLPDGIDATEAILGALPDAAIASAVREALVEQVERAAPDLDAPTTARLAALDPREVTLARLEQLGYPVGQLPEQVREPLVRDAELRSAGWTGDGLVDDADVDGLLDLLDRELGDQLGRVLVDDAALLSITTRGAGDEPFAMTGAIDARLDPMRDLGLEVEVVSQALLLEVTLQALTGSQTDAIGVTLLAALLLLIAYYTVSDRRPALGVITMIPSLLSLPLILGAMVLAGLSFNALTVTVASISVGIGVPYGIHLTNRFLESRRRTSSPEAAVRDTVRHTGGALAGSAITTAVGFGVLLLSALAPIRQFGLVTAITIGFALVTALLVETSALVLWDRYHRARGRHPQGPSSPAAATDAMDTMEVPT